MNWTVYLLKCSDGTLYCGITCDVIRRLDEHNGLVSGGAKYTRSRRPVELFASITAKDRSEAMQLEIRIKRMKRVEKITFFQEATQALGAGSRVTGS
jgi:putative endonuclease